MMMIIGDRFSAMTTDRKRIRGYENFTYVGTVDGTNDPRVFTKRGWRNGDETRKSKRAGRLKSADSILHSKRERRYPRCIVAHCG